jgi:CheY-like chemotaxis protein
LLTPIVGSLDMLQRRRIGGEREQRLIEGGLQAAERAKTLVQRLLAFARRQPLQPVAVDLPQLVAGMAELISRTCGPTVQVRVDVAPDLPAARADPNQLEMAILNLSVNARDAMPQGGELMLSAAAESILPGHRSRLRPGNYIRLAVADTGIGMDEAMMVRAVEPFFSTKGLGKGTGLGLSMVHGLTSQLGGALLISSQLGRGTTVEMWLPVSADSAAASTRQIDSSAATRTAGVALLVDAEDLACGSTADMLADLGYDVMEATSAEDALRLIENGLTLDILITDHLMPGMSGIDLAQTVRRRRPGTPVLIISGYADVESMAPDLPRLTKPFRQSDLIARMAELKPAAAE